MARRTSRSRSRWLWFACGAALVASPSAATAADYVIHISVDGLRSDAVTAVGPSASNFYRFRTQGAFTDNARTDYDSTDTLPNHTSELTGRAVLDRGSTLGHRWTANSTSSPDVTTHGAAGYYVTSTFDVAHDNGLRTGLYASKERFALYNQSYGPTTGAADVTGADNGRDKIDRFVSPELDAPGAVAALLADMASPATRSRYAFLHLTDPDTAGHGSLWNVTDPGSAYLNAVRAVDGYLGQIFHLVESTPGMAGHTAILLTADHGGPEGFALHSNPADPKTYTIPFYAWGDGVAAGDLYAMNAGTRLDPGTGRPDYTDVGQPIRNGDVGNLALDLLGLDAIPGSSINAGQNLIVPEPATGGLLLWAVMALATRRRRRRLARRWVAVV